MGLFSRQKTTQTNAKKYDGMIEAVRRTDDGQIQVARFYERRGPTWSDHMLIDRGELINRLKKGQKFGVGERKRYLGGTFSIFTNVQLNSDGGKETLVTSNTPDSATELKEAPIF